MNKNVEIISPFHVGVMKEYIKAGYIKELQPIEGMQLEQINLSNTGVIILDKGSLYYPILRKVFKKISKMKDKELKEKFVSFQGEPKEPENFFMYNALGFELKRRAIRKEYLKSRSIKQRFDDWIERRVKRYGKH